MDELRFRIQEELDSHLIEGYRHLSLALAIYFAVLIPVTALVQTPGRPVRLTVLILAMLVLLGTYIRLRVRQSMNHAIGLATLAMTAVLFQILVNILTIGDARLTSDFMLWIVGTALVLRRRLWFLGVLLAGISLWTTTYLCLADRGPGLHWSLGILTATVLAVALHIMLGRMHQAQVDLRIQDRIREQTLAHMVALLQDTLENVRALSGLIPICAQCKKVRNDEGYWQQVEHYVAEHSEARFSHGLCPTCAKAFLQEARGQEAVADPSDEAPISRPRSADR